jgi:hypothetical protein
LRYWGNLTRSELYAMMTGYRNVPDYDPAFDVLQDFRGTETNELTYSDVSMMAENTKAFRQKVGVEVRLALLAPGDLGFGMGRMFTTLLGNCPLINADVFRDLEGAAAFLDLSAQARTLIGNGANSLSISVSHRT